jgi:pimeloyl-ACP methyl ester carboxylesterase
MYDKIDLDVSETGSGDDLVVFVHGVLDRGRSFQHVAEQLAGECRVLCYDRRGYAGSAGAAGSPAGVDDHVEDLLALIDGRRAVLVGHSFGGVIASGAAVAEPEVVEALALYETIMWWTPGWDDRIVRGILGSDDPEVAGLRLILGARYDDMPANERDRLRPAAAAFVTEERTARDRSPLFDLGAIRAPVVYGTSAPDLTGRVSDHLRTKVPFLEVVDVPGAGHHGHRTAPEAFTALVRRALELARLGVER